MMSPRPRYNRAMARGWESKSVEAQQADASEKPSQPRASLTPRQAARQREIEGLQLSSRRIAQQLASTQDARRRKMLEQAQAALEKMIQEID